MTQYEATRAIFNTHKCKWIKIDAIAELIYGSREWPESYVRSIEAIVQRLRERELWFIIRKDNKYKFVCPIFTDNKKALTKEREGSEHHI